MSTQQTPGPRLERKAFYCGTKPDGTPVHKFGWVAHVNGRTIGDETVNRGNYGKTRWEPRYLTRADAAAVAKATRSPATIGG